MKHVRIFSVLACAACLSVMLLSSCTKTVYVPATAQNAVPQQQSVPQQQFVPQQHNQVDPVEQLVKEYTADGFKSESMAFTMYESIASFRQTLLSNPNLVEIIEEGTGASSFSAEMQALNGAAIKYATTAGSVVEGGLESDFGNLEASTYNTFHGAYIQSVAEFVMPLLEKKMKFVKKSNNSYEVKVGYLLDESKAQSAREQAANKALQKVGDGMAFGEGVRKYVKEVIRPENN